MEPSYMVTSRIVNTSPKSMDFILNQHSFYYVLISKDTSSNSTMRLFSSRIQLTIKLNITIFKSQNLIAVTLKQTFFHQSPEIQWTLQFKRLYSPIIWFSCEQIRPVKVGLHYFTYLHRLGFRYLFPAHPSSIYGTHGAKSSCIRRRSE